VEIARRKCRTFLSTFCQLNYIKHGSSPTQCAVATPKVGHLPQARPSVRESVVSIELCNFESVIFSHSGRGWRFRDELHWKETPAWPHREITRAGGCAVARLPGVVNGASPNGAPAPGDGTPPLPKASDLKTKPLTPLSEKAKIAGYVMGHVADSLGHLHESAHQDNTRLLETSTGSSPAQTGPLAQDNQLTSFQVPHVPLEEVSRIVKTVSCCTKKKW